MSKLTLKIFLAVYISIVTPFSVNAIAADEVKDGKESVKSMGVDVIPNITFLSREMSQSLKITPIPTSEPIPLVMGTYWNCSVNAQDFEICRIKIVVCEDDQSFCVEVDSERGNVQDITFLPREKSKSLGITLIPTSKPIPLIVGIYWNCPVNAQGFEICRIRIVVCTDDQSSCVEV